MGVSTPDESFRRAGDILQAQLLEEMRYLRKRLDQVIDGMATKDSVSTLSAHVDTEVRSLEGKIHETKLELSGSFDKKVDDTKTELSGQIDDVKKLIPAPSPNTGFVVGATATVTTIIVGLIGYIVFLQIALRTVHPV